MDFFFCSQIWYWSFQLCWACKTCEIVLPKPSVIWLNDNREAWLYLHSGELSGDKFYSYILEHLETCLKQYISYLLELFHVRILFCWNLFWNFMIVLLVFWHSLIVLFPMFQNLVLYLLVKVFSFVKNQSLSNCRTEVCKALEMAEEQCELSMGMSSDFELAVWNSVLKLFSNKLLFLIVALHDCICITSQFWCYLAHKRMNW